MKKTALRAIVITSMIAACPAVSKAMMLGTYDFAGSGGSSGFLTELEFRLDTGLGYIGPLFEISWIASPEDVGDTFFVSAETDAYFEIAAYVLRNGVSDRISFVGGGGGRDRTDCSFFTKSPSVYNEYCDFHGCDIAAISLTVNALTLEHPTDSRTNYSYDVTFTVWGEPPVPTPVMIYYVDADASGSNNGSSWANAYNYLHDALLAASRGDEIWVAQGIYKPDQGGGMTPGDRTATFQPINGITIKGGYAGFGEADPDARDINAYETILSGDLNGDDGPICANNGENSYRVVTENGTDETAVLDGFTITGGTYDGMYNFFSSPTLTNCTFSMNSGGGMYNSQSSPTLTNCTFSRNSATFGGGMYNRNSSPMLTNCIFTTNSSTYEGGGIYNYRNSSPILTNCTFSANSAANGNALACDSPPHRKYPSNVQITNCILWDGGNEIWNGDNSTITIAYSDVQGGWPGEGNIDADPCFARPGYWAPTLPRCAIEPSPSDGAINVSINADLGWIAGYGATSHDVYFGTSNPPPFICNQTSTTFDPGTMDYDTTYYWRIDEVNDTDITYGNTWSFTTFMIPPPPPPPSSMSILTTSNMRDNQQYIWVEGDYHLLAGSPCIDTGDPNYAAESVKRDFDGKPRVMGGRIDMGAYEHGAVIPAEFRITPRTINLASKGNRLTCYIRLTEQYNVADIDPNSIFIEDEIEPEQLRLAEDQQVAIARFNREEVQNILSIGRVQLRITGQLRDGTFFDGTDTIRVRVIDDSKQKDPNSQIPEFYYYASGEKIYLDIYTEKIAVCFEENVTDPEKEAVIKKIPILEAIAHELYDFVPNMVLIETSAGTTEVDIISAMQRLEKLRQVRFSTVVFGDIHSQIILTDEFFAKFKPDVTEQQIEAFNSLHNVEFIEKFPSIDLYLLRVKDPTNMNMLTTANLYYENPLTEYAGPNFIVMGPPP
jgi:parallel beta-helix repeat protein